MTEPLRIGHEKRLHEVANFPLFEALFSRRSRRFAYGMEIPHGPLAFKRGAPRGTSQEGWAMANAWTNMGGVWLGLHSCGIEGRRGNTKPSTQALDVFTREPSLPLENV